MTSSYKKKHQGSSRLFDDCRCVVDYDCNTIRNCSKYGCDSICRCGKLDVVINEVYSHEMAKFIANHINESNNDLLIQSLEKYINQKIDATDFYPEICSGYYGEELDKISVSDCIENDLISYAQALSKENDYEVLKQALFNEHGFLTKNHQNISAVDSHKQKLILLLKNIQLTNHNPNIEKIKSLMNITPDNFVIQYDGEKYNGGHPKLIDGHHRLQVLLNQLADNPYPSIYSQEQVNNFEKVLGRKNKKLLNKEVKVYEVIIEDKEKQLKETIESLKDRITDLEEEVRKLNEKLSQS